jgi:hypothetical protein
MTGVNVGDLVRVNSTGSYGVVTGVTGGQSGSDIKKLYVLHNVGTCSVVLWDEDNLTVIGNAFDSIPRSLKDEPPAEGKSYIPLRPEAHCPGGCHADESARSAPDILKHHMEMSYTHWVPKPSLPNLTPEEREEAAFYAWWAGPSCVSGDSYRHTANAAWMARARKDRE